MANLSSETCGIIKKQASKGKTKPSGTSKPGAACAFLVEEKCSIYENRPMICRTWMSLSEADCISKYKTGTEGGNDLPIPVALGLAYNLFVNDHPTFYEINTLFDFIMKNGANLEDYSKGLIPPPKALAATKRIPIKIL